MKLKNIRSILVLITIIIGGCHDVMAGSTQNIVLVDGRKVAQYAGSLYPNLLPGETQSDRTFRIANIFMKEFQEYSKRHNVVIFDLDVYIAGDIKNITDEICNSMKRKKQE